MSTENPFMIEPDANITLDLTANAVSRIKEGFSSIRPKLEAVAHERAEALLSAHRRVQTAARIKGIRYRVEPYLPPDVPVI